MPLNIIVVGAGIAGLCTAIALRQAGHQVVIYEKSKFAAEIGAALMITPNGARVLSNLGFSFANARAVKIEKWNVVRGKDQMPIHSVDTNVFEDTFGDCMYSIHRVDLHHELLRLARNIDGDGYPIRINLSSEVIDSSETGTITLKDSSHRSADLVVAADGLHSSLRKSVLGCDTTVPIATGLSAFRFLLDTRKMNESNPVLSDIQMKGFSATLLADTDETTSERHIMAYPCRNGHIYNVVGIHPTRTDVADDNEGCYGRSTLGVIRANCKDETIKTSMLDEFSHFAPEIIELFKEAEYAKVWPLYVYKPLSNWYQGRVLLVGDAAHPMLPFGGQGSNSAIEDAGTLGYMLRDVHDPNLIPERLQLFQRARQSRASRVQILSSVRAGNEKDVREQLEQFADPPGSSVPTTMVERTKHDYSFDIFKKCQEVMVGAI